eukprot:scaffold1942_cov351-Prasinococcus_capsulatus_cf.AAC.11
MIVGGGWLVGFCPTPAPVLGAAAPTVARHVVVGRDAAGGPQAACWWPDCAHGPERRARRTRGDWGGGGDDGDAAPRARARSIAGAWGRHGTPSAAPPKGARSPDGHGHLRVWRARGVTGPGVRCLTDGPHNTDSHRHSHAGTRLV